jgi:hypothetical protein
VLLKSKLQNILLNEKKLKGKAGNMQEFKVSENKI